MKKLIAGSIAVLLLGACTTAIDEDQAPVPESAEMMTAMPTTESEPEQEEVCAIRDPDDGECLCKVANENGECVEGGGVVIIPGPPVEEPRTDSGGGTVIIPDAGVPEE